jgi:hypothetical protein
MKNLRFLFALSVILMIVFQASCSLKLNSKSSGHLPPGQAKKISGSQSARNYAPGHQKH